MLALSIRQPYSWLIIQGLKDIENRDWPTRVRGRIYIHAGKRWDSVTQIEIRAMMHEAGRSYAEEQWFSKWVGENCWGWHSAIVGEVDIADCVTESESPWFCGEYGFVLANPLAYPAPVPCKGQLGFFPVPPEVEAACQDQPVAGHRR